MKLPIRLTLATAFTVFTVIAVMLVAGFNFYSSRHAILETAKVNILNSIVSAEQGIEGLIGRASLTTETIAHLPKQVFDWRRPDILFASLAVGLSNSPQIYSVYVGFNDGAFVQAVNLVSPDGSRRQVAGMPGKAATAWRIIKAHAEGEPRLENWRFFDVAGTEFEAPENIREKLTAYDPRRRLWFQESQQSGALTLSKAYVFASLKRLGITISKPLYHLPGATVGIDLSLDDLSQLTAQLSPGKNGVVAIVDHEGDVVAYPATEKTIGDTDKEGAAEIVHVTKIDDLRLNKAIAEAKAETLSDFSFSVGDEDFIASIEPIHAGGTAGWQVLSIAAVADFTSQVVTDLQHILFIAAVILVIAVYVVTVMAGWIAKPVLHLATMAEQITRLNFSEIKTLQTPFLEVERLQQSMEHMRGALDMFLRFVPRDVVRELVKPGQAVSVGGTKRQVTLLFTDVEGYTSMAERLTPEQIMAQTAEYFERMSFVVQANRGTIDKFIGDAMMVMWNAPVVDELHVDNACRGTLAAYHISEELNIELAEKGLALMRTRFGLHTAEVLVGNVGARDRMQYTCLGAGVNLASRIEGLNKFYGTQVLASDAVRRKASPSFLFRRVDIVEAKGTSIPVTIYELMGERGETASFPVDDETLKRASTYEQAFDHYLHRDFNDAIEILERLIEEKPDDPVVRLLLGKCRAFVETPPPLGWNGATVLDDK